MNKETIKATAHLYQYQGHHFFDPEADLKKGAYVVSILPLVKVDPVGKYQFVIDSNGKTHTVAKNRLILIEEIPAPWERELFDTHNMEVSKKIKAASVALMKWLVDNGHIRVETMDCTPTWRWAFGVYLAVLEQEWANRNPDQEKVENAKKGLYDAADALDRINKMAKENDGVVKIEK